MDSYVFSPDRTEDLTYLIIGLFVAAVGYWIAWRLYRRPGTGDELNRRLLTAMLLGFVATIGLGTSIFSGWNYARLLPVEVSEEGLRIGKENLPFAEIRNAHIEEEQSYALLNPQTPSRTSRFLVVESSEGKAYVFGEDQYPIREMMGRMREFVRPPEAAEREE
ncbi:MAG: hypothetical protein KDC54_11075 [Lewinella sp.]|nr:hypothetical protein [Lewinella sp.]